MDSENDCADGKLYCRPTATKALRTPIDGSAIIKEVISSLIKRDPDQTEFHQAAREVLESLVPVIEAHPEFADNSLLERMVEPERTISFRVPWTDDSGATHVNRLIKHHLPASLSLTASCTPILCPSFSYFDAWAVSESDKSLSTGATVCSTTAPSGPTKAVYASTRR